MNKPWNKLRLAYSEPKQILRAIDMWDGERLLVIGDGSMGAYEWAIEKGGNVTQHSDCGYGIADVALRDGLIAYHGMPQPDGWFMRTIKPRYDGSGKPCAVSESERSLWVPVSRKPAPRQVVLLTSGEVMSTGYWTNEDGWFVDALGESDPFVNPTHWMALPEGPK